MLYNEWNTLKVGIRNAKSVNIFEKSIISKKKENLLYRIYDPLGFKLFTSLRLQFSHLKEHKFRNGCSDRINPMRACKTEVETTKNFLSCCHFYRLED